MSTIVAGDDEEEPTCPECGAPLPADAPQGLCPRCLSRIMEEYVSAVNAGEALPEAQAMDLLARAGADALANPSLELQWTLRAEQCEHSADWPGAEEARKQSVQLALAHSQPLAAVKALVDLAGLYRMLGRHEDARAPIQTALTLARDGGITSLLLMALKTQYHAPLQERELYEIRADAAAGFAALSEEKERIFDLPKARFLLLQARCAADLGALDEAEIILAQARDFITDPNPPPIMVGYHAFHARAAELSAQLHAARGHSQQAIAAFAEAVARERTIHAQPQVPAVRTAHRLALALFSYANYLDAGGQSHAASNARAEAQELWNDLQLPPRDNSHGRPL